MLGVRVVFEISVRNAEKQRIQKTDLLTRVKQFEDSVAVTDAPLFTQKAQLFPGCFFVIGFDTAERILDERFYAGSRSRMVDSLRLFQDQRNRFLVGGRRNNVGVFCGCDSLKIPSGFETLFSGLTEAEFREDVSSTEIRRKQRVDPNEQT